MIEQWQATAVVAAPEWEPGDLDDLDAAFESEGARDPGGERVIFTWPVEAMNCGGATQKALNWARRAIKEAEPRERETLLSAVRRMPRLVELRVRLREDAARPPAMDLAGAKEAAAILGVATSRVAELRARDDFPQPVAVLASGPVWEAGTLRRYAAVRPRAGGRPRKTA